MSARGWKLWKLIAEREKGAVPWFRKPYGAKKITPSQILAIIERSFTMRRISRVSRYLALVLALVMCFSMNAFAVDRDAPQKFVYDGITFEVGIDQTEPHPMPLVLIYQKEVSNTTRYLAAFTCNRNNGPRMRFTVENTGDYEIKVTMTYQGTTANYYVAPGETKYTLATAPEGETLEEEFEFLLESTGPMECLVYADQY